MAEEEQETQEEQQAQGAQSDSDAVQGPGDDGEDQEEAQQPRAVRDPGQPTQAMIDEHDLTHIPYRPWCDTCVRGKAKRKPSRTISGAYSESQCARVRIDYAYLTENVEAVEVGDSRTVSVVVNSVSARSGQFAWPRILFLCALFFPLR